MAKKRQAPTKICPECSTPMHAATRQCPTCGHQFAAKKSAKKKVAKAKKGAKRPAGDFKQQLTAERGRLLAEQEQMQERLNAIETLLR